MAELVETRSHSNVRTDKEEIKLALVDQSSRKSTIIWQVWLQIGNILCVIGSLVLANGWRYWHLFFLATLLAIAVVGLFRRRFNPYISVTPEGFTFARSWSFPGKRMSDGFRKSGVMFIRWPDLKLMVRSNFSLLLFRKEGTHCVVNLTDIDFKQDQTTLTRILDFARSKGVEVVEM